MTIRSSSPASETEQVVGDCLCLDGVLPGASAVLDRNVLAPPLTTGAGVARPVVEPVLSVLVVLVGPKAFLFRFG